MQVTLSGGNFGGEVEEFAADQITVVKTDENNEIWVYIRRDLKDDIAFFSGNKA